MTETKKKPSAAQRCEHNRRIAVKLAKAGIYILPASSKKLPMIPSYNVADHSLNAEQREFIRADYVAKHGHEPVHIGASNNLAVIRKIWNAMPHAVPGIACGPSKIVVIDADKKHDGPRKLTTLIKAEGIKVDNSPITETGSGGLHLVFADQHGQYTNAAGAFSDLGCDIRANGGFIVAPGALLDDGKKYTAMPGAADLADSFVRGTIPEMPVEFVELIGTKRTGERNDDSAAVERSNISATEGTIRQAVISGAMPYGEALLDPAFGFDLESLAAKYPNVIAAVDDAALGPLDHSVSRFNIIAALKAEGATAVEVASIMLSGGLNDYVGSYVGSKIGKGVNGPMIVEAKLDPQGGTFNLRNVARDYERANVRKDHSEAFGAVDENEHELHAKPKVATIWGYDAHRDYKPMEWLIDGLVPAQGVGVLYGDGNVGKSFLGFDMLDHVKRGKTWFGRDIVRGGAMYLCAEGQAGISSRLKALYDERPVGSRYDSIAVRGDLPVFGDRPKIAAKIVEKMIVEAQAESGEPIKVVFLDNLSRMEGSIEENAQGDMTQIFTALGELSRKLDLVFIVAHHTIKSGETYRGSTAIRNSADFMLAVTEDGSGVRTIKIDKMRDAAKGEAVKFKLKVREVGTNQFGKAVTSCVVVPAGAADVTGVMGVADDVERVPDDLAGRAAALARIVSRLAMGGEAGAPVGTVLKAWNITRGGQVDLDGDPLSEVAHVQMKRAIKVAVDRGMLRETDGRLRSMDIRFDADTDAKVAPETVTG